MEAAARARRRIPTAEISQVRRAAVRDVWLLDGPVVRGRLVRLRHVRRRRRHRAALRRLHGGLYACSVLPHESSHGVCGSASRGVCDPPGLAADDAGAFAATFGGATIEHSACRSPCADDRTETKRGANAVFPLLGDVVPYYDVPPRGSSAASPPSGPPPPPPPHAAEPPLDAAAADDDNWYSDDGWYDDVDEGLFRQWLEADWPADDDAAAEVLYDIDDHGDDAIWTAFDDDGYPDLIDDDAYYYYYGAYGDDAEVRGDLSSSGATGLALRFEVFVAQVEARVTAAMQALSAARKK